VNEIFRKSLIPLRVYQESASIAQAFSQKSRVDLICYINRGYYGSRKESIRTTGRAQ